MKTWTTLFVTGMFLATPALADDVDDVKAAEDRYYAAMNSGDARAWAQSRLSEESTRFGPNGELLEVFGSLEEQEQNRKAAVDAGLKYNLRARHRDIRVYGNTAVVTLYGSGTVGNNTQVNNRITRVWGKQGGQWKMVHAHLSPLTISTSSIEDRFVGTWRFVSIEQRNAQGELLPVISGRTGFIIYTPTGHMAVQLMEDDRKEFAGAQPSGEEARAALASYNAYSGTFTVNEAQGTVIHHRQTKLTPGTVDALGGTDVIRSYRFSGNQLMLTPPPRMIDGEELTRTLVWERIE
jgi:ketosteroid isomerase-like protein